MQGELDELCQEKSLADEKAKKAVSDAAAMAEELKKEQMQSTHVTRLKSNLESSLKDLQSRLEQSEQAAMSGGKKQMQKLDDTIRSLETELTSEQRRHFETQKNQKKLERKLKEVV